MSKQNKRRNFSVKNSISQIEQSKNWIREDQLKVMIAVNSLEEDGGVSKFVQILYELFQSNFHATVNVIGITGKKSADTLKRFGTNNVLSFSEEKQSIINLMQDASILISTQIYAHFSIQNYIKSPKVFLMFHGDAKELLKGGMYINEKILIKGRLLRNFNKLLLLSKNNCDYFKQEKIYNESKLDYVMNPFWIFDKKNLFKKNLTYVYVGRLAEEKNIFSLISVFEIVLSIQSNSKLEIYGDGPLKKQLMYTIKERNLSDSVLYKGYSTNKDAIYGNKSGLILTSHTEGTPFVILESYAFGIPVYAYNSFLAAKEMICNGTGLIAPHGDEQQLANMIINGVEINTSKMASILKKFSSHGAASKWSKLIFESESNLADIKISETNLKSHIISFFYKAYYHIRLIKRIILRISILK